MIITEEIRKKLLEKLPEGIQVISTTKISEGTMSSGAFYSSGSQFDSNKHYKKEKINNLGTLIKVIDRFCVKDFERLSSGYELIFQIPNISLTLQGIASVNQLQDELRALEKVVKLSDQKEQKESRETLQIIGLEGLAQRLQILGLEQEKTEPESSTAQRTGAPLQFSPLPKPQSPEANKLPEVGDKNKLTS